MRLVSVAIYWPLLVLPACRSHFLDDITLDAGFGMVLVHSFSIRRICLGCMVSSELSTETKNLL